MIHYTGWCFCTRSNWDNECFDVRNLVAIEYKEKEDYNKLLIKGSAGIPDRPWATYVELRPEVYN